MAHTKLRASANALADLLALSLGFAVGSQIVGVVHAARVANSLNATMAPVWLVSPEDGETVSGGVEVSAGATADIVSLQFQLNGVNLGPLITSGACTMNWNTGAVSNGSYAVSVLADDGTGNPVSSPAATVTVANASLQISSVATSNITSTSATITWTTNQPATSSVSYGVTAFVTVTDDTYVTQHASVLVGLSPNASYHFTVTSSNGLGATATSADAGLTTPDVPHPPPPPPPPPNGGLYRIDEVAADQTYGVFANTQVRLEAFGKTRAVTTTDATGRFRFTRLTAGTYTVSVMLPGGQTLVLFTRTFPN